MGDSGELPRVPQPQRFSYRTFVVRNNTGAQCEHVTELEARRTGAAQVSKVEVSFKEKIQNGPGCVW